MRGGVGGGGGDIFSLCHSMARELFISNGDGVRDSGHTFFF